VPATSRSKRPSLHNGRDQDVASEASSGGQQRGNAFVATRAQAASGPATPRAPATGWGESLEAQTEEVERTDQGANQEPASIAAHVGAGGELIRGATGPAVRELQVLMGMPSKEQDGIFGPRTEAFLKRKQSEAGIQATGRLGRTTYQGLGGGTASKAPSTNRGEQHGRSGEGTASSALDMELGRYPELSEGFRGPAVREIQMLLGMQGESLTGVFGPTTKKVLMDFQRRHGVKTTGAVGPTTLDFLRRNSSANGILFDHKTTGASSTTARGNGVGGRGEEASEVMADQDRKRLLGMREAFMASADKYDLPPALLAAIASRETRGGNQLRSDGYSQWDGNGFGVMQVDYRHHRPQGGAKSQSHVDQAASILANYRKIIQRNFPDWTESRQLQAAVYAYNRGPGSVTSSGSLDALSPGGDYSSDVWARARHLSQDFGGTDTTIRVEPEVAENRQDQQTSDTEQIADPAAKDEESTKPGATEQDNGRPGGTSTADLATTIMEGGKFKQGDTGAAVLEVQRLLGFGPKGQTGELGPYTAQKLKEFQKSRGLAADGVVGPATYDALINASKMPGAPIVYQHGMNSGYSDGYCGIATVLQTLKAAGKDPGIDTNNRQQLDRFANQMYIPGKGSSGNAMARVLRDGGEKDANMTYSGSVRDIVASLDKGKTVPVGFASMGGSVTKTTQSWTRHGSLREGDRFFHQFGGSGHWASVVGYEGDPGRPTHFLVNDPDTGAQLRLTRSELERHTKAREGIWMIRM